MKMSKVLEVFYGSMVTVKSPGTIQWYKKILSQVCDYLNDPEIDQIDLVDLELYRGTLSRKSKAPGKPHNVSNWTIHGHCRAIKRFFNWAKKRKYITYNPAEDLEKPPLPKQPRKGISEKEKKIMIQTAMSNQRDYAILCFVADTGCRAAGIYNLLKSDLDLDHYKAVVREKGQGNQKQRTVFYTTETAYAIEIYLRYNPSKSDHVFCRWDGKPLTYSGVYQIFRSIALKAGVESGWNPHNWRHAAIRGWLLAGMNLKSASEIAGHTSEKVTADIYGTLNEIELQMIYNEIQARHNQGDS